MSLQICGEAKRTLVALMTLMKPTGALPVHKGMTVLDVWLAGKRGIMGYVCCKRECVRFHPIKQSEAWCEVWWNLTFANKKITSCFNTKAWISMNLCNHTKSSPHSLCHWPPPNTLHPALQCLQGGMAMALMFSLAIVDRILTAKWLQKFDQPTLHTDGS